MDDRNILKTIQQLVDEERALREEAADASTPEARRRLDDIEVQLDQCWDLLRQRRGRRHAGQDPDTAEARDPETVERYIQ